MLRMTRRTVRPRAALAGALASALLLAGCIDGPGDRRGHRPIKRMVQPTPSLKQCLAKLDSSPVRYTPLSDRSYGGGCTAYGAVRLDDIGVPTTNLGPMTCAVAQNFSAWVRYGVAPAARLYLGSELVRVDTFGTYSCRTVAGSGRLSEHAHANAVDVAAFLLADGRRISVQNGWGGEDAASRRFLRVVRDSACKRFRTVLSPDYNGAHHDHLHFDMGGRGGYCR